jgi:hypothetical protein
VPITSPTACPHAREEIKTVDDRIIVDVDPAMDEA